MTRFPEAGWLGSLIARQIRSLRANSLRAKESDLLERMDALKAALKAKYAKDAS